MSDTFELVPESEISNAKEIEIGDKAMGAFQHALLLCHSRDGRFRSF